MVGQPIGDVKMLDLTPLSGRHVNGLLTLAGDDPDVPWPVSSARSPRQRVVAFVADAQRLRARDARATFAVRDGRRLVGLVVLARVAGSPHQAELGYWIGRSARDRGYATAAARRVVAYGFDTMNLESIVAHCPLSSPASARVLAKLGFRFVGPEPSPGPTPAASPIHRYELTANPRQLATR